MEQERFDAALRALQAGTTRRAGLAGMLGVLLGGVGAGLDAAASGKRKGTGRPDRPAAEGPCGDGGSTANRCKKNGDCCTRYCADGACRCKPNYMTCTKSAHCCAGKCVGGRCDGGAKPDGSACTENFNCKSGLACVKGVCTASATVKCTARNCPGCCDGTTCRTGRTTAGCGTAGAACTACLGGETCNAGVCGAGTPPPPTCTPANCANGCCDGTTCVTATDGTACGTGGAACVACTSSSQPVCVAGVCAAGTWAYLTQMGTGVCGPANDQFNVPYDVVVSADELTAYIADYVNNRMAIWTRPDTSTAWDYQTQMGTGVQGSGNDQFKNPTSLFVAADQLTAYIADYWNHRIAIWTRPDTSTAWTYQSQMGTGVQGSGNDQFKNPWGIFVAADQLTAYITDSSNSRIAIWTRPDTSTAWAYQSQMGTGVQGSGNDQFNGPRSVVVSADGLTAWISDTFNDRIVIWTRTDTSAAWAYQSQIGTGTSGSGNDSFNKPYGISVAADQLTIWIGDAQNNRVVIWTRPDTSSAWAYQSQMGTGTNGSANDQLWGPSGVSVSADSQTIWIADVGNCRISIWEQSAP